MISTDIVKPGLQPAEPIPPFIRAAHKNGIAELTERLYKTLLLRSGFKIPDQVQGQGVRPIGKAQHTWVCEHLPEACNASIEP